MAARKAVVIGSDGLPQQIQSGDTVDFGSNGGGYATGDGGSFAQSVSKTSTVVTNAPCGQITMSSAALAANAAVRFTVTNSYVATVDGILLTLKSGATAGAYNYQIDAVAAGSFVIWVQNISAGSLSEALMFNFQVIKGANS